MKHSKTPKLAGLLLLCICVVAFSCALNLLSYKYDNKYTYWCRQAVDGVLQLDEYVLEQTPVLFLTSGWELYCNWLITPADFARTAPEPDLYTVFGEFSGFEEAGMSRSPHGSATYRMVITLPQQAQNYTLELPEIYSSCWVYINGTLLAERGNPNPQQYWPETKSSALTFRAATQAEIIVAVSDFSHFYSGMIYPPAFGESQAVANLLNTRLVLRTAVCAVALGIGLFYLCVGLFIPSKRNRLPLIYGFFCLCFVGYVCYPLYKTLIGGGVYPWYAIEHVCYFAMLVLLTILHSRICAVCNVLTKLIVAWGVLLCVFAAIMCLPVRGESLHIMLAYSWVVDAYKWALACYLTVFSAISVYRKVFYSKLLLSGILVFNCALIMDSLLPLYQPIIFGGFIETAGFILVLSIGCALGLSVVQQYRTNLLLEKAAKHTQQQLDWQADHYRLLTEHIDEAKRNRHDLRHQLTVLKSFTEAGDLNSLHRYIDEYLEKLQQHADLPLCENYVGGAVARYYCSLAKHEGICVEAKLGIPQHIGRITDTDLCITLGNLLENALEACRRMNDGQRFIQAFSTLQGGYLTITVINSYDGALHKEGGIYYSRKHKGKGVGLSSVRAITAKYEGTAHYEAQDAKFIASAVMKI